MTSAGNVSAGAPASGPSAKIAAVSLAEMEKKLSLVTNVLPISHAAREVYSMAMANKYSTQQLAAAAARDPSLIAELLRQANSAYYNPSGRRIVELEQAITRIGQKRVGQLALAASMSSALTRTVLPWMNLQLLWRRSLAAGVAVEMIVTEGKHQAIEEGLLICGIMHSLGRVVLGALFPQHYQQMVAACQQSGQSLLEQERAVFAQTHAQVMSRLLTSWKVPEEVSRPLNHLLDDYTELEKLDEPIRTKVELIKLAVLIGQLAVGHWEPWDLVELPPPTLLKSLRVTQAGVILQQTKDDAESIANFQTTAAPVRPGPGALAKKEPQLQVGYANLTGGSFDFLAEILAGMAIQLVKPPDAIEALHEPILFNSVGVTAARLRGSVSPELGRWVTMVTDRNHAELFPTCSAVLTIPCSYRTLHDVCRKLGHQLAAAEAH